MRNQQNQPTQNDAFKTIELRVPKHSPLNQELIYQLHDFFDLVHPKALKKRLLKILLQYLISYHDELPNDFGEVAEDYYLLFELLDTVGEGRH